MDTPTLRQLQYFLAVAEHLSFHKAAETCYVTQPTLSEGLKSLEDLLGTKLFERTKRNVALTPSGTELILPARDILARAEDFVLMARARKEPFTGKLTLGVIPTIAPYMLHKFIPDFVRRYPKVELEIREMKTEYIIDALNRDRIDAALVAGGTCGDGILEYDLFDDRFFAYVSPDSPLYNKSNIRIEDIDMRDLILLSAGNCMRDQVLELCQARKGVPAHYSFESGSLDTLMRIVDCTSCMTVIPEMAVEYIPKERRSQVKNLLKGASSRKISLAIRRTYVKKSIVDALKETILECVAPSQRK